MIDFSTVVAVDVEHLKQLEIVWPTWRLFRPEILDQPIIVICDGALPVAEWSERLAFLQHSNCTIVLWHMASVSQRDKMLNGLVFKTAEMVKTEWYLKLDTDAAAVQKANWIQPLWFEPNDEGAKPVFVTNPWGYTKPPDAIEQLDRWGDTVPDLQAYPRLNLKPKPGADLVSHRRIISWCFFGSAAWTREVSSYCPDRLPVPSQDTFLWYCAARRGDFYRTVRMSRVGWRHVSSTRRLRWTCDEALAKPLN